MNSLTLEQSTEPVGQQVNGNCLGVGEPLRLNLGGAGEGFRDGKIDGFKVVDLRPGPDTDIVSDVKDLSFCKDNTVQDIYASNVLEHFPHNQTQDVLREWFRVLKPGGKLYVSVPDFQACIRLYNKVGLAEWVLYLIWGDQKHSLNYHYINFDEKLLSWHLKMAGFSSFERVKHLPWGVQDASEIVDSVEGLPISLNMVARK